MYTEWLFLVLIILIIAYFSTRGKFNLRRWVFILVLFSLFLMVGVYGGEVAADYISGPKPSWGDPRYSELIEERELVKGLTWLGFGILGLGLLTGFYKGRTLELGISFGIAGLVLIMGGLIVTLEKRPVVIKFIACIIGLLIVSFFVYRYRERLVGEKTG